MATQKTKNSMLNPHDWFKAVSKISDEDAGKLWKALYLLDISGETTEFEPGTIVDVLYSQYSELIIRNKDKYEESCRNRSGAAKKREAQKAQKSTKEHSCDDKDKDKDKDKENDIDDALCRIGDAIEAEVNRRVDETEQSILDRILLEWNSRKVTRKIGQSIRPMTSRYDAIRILLAAYSFEQFISTIRSLDEQEWLVQRLKERNIHVDFDSFLKPENFKNYFEGKYKDVYKEEKRKPASKFSNFEERSYSENQYDALEQAMGG